MEKIESWVDNNGISHYTDLSSVAIKCTCGEITRQFTNTMVKRVGKRRTANFTKCESCGRVKPFKA